MSTIKNDRLILSKEFKIVNPDAKIQKSHRDYLAKLHAEQTTQIAQLHRAQREAQAEYRKAMVKQLTAHGDFKPAKRNLQYGLGQRVSTGPGLLSSPTPPPPPSPGGTGTFVRWADGSKATPANNAYSSGTLKGNYEVDLTISAGTEIHDGQTQQGGSTSVWGYVGQYVQCAVQEQIFPLLSVTAAPAMVYAPEWSVTNISFFGYSPFSENANLTMGVNIICMCYDPDWNYLLTYSGPLAWFYSNQNANSGSFDTDWTPYSLVLDLPLLPSPIANGWNLGIFVQFQAWASAAGYSDGPLDLGSTVNEATLNGSVNFLQISLPSTTV
jgi:hypothetical protein